MSIIKSHGRQGAFAPRHVRPSFKVEAFLTYLSYVFRRICRRLFGRNAVHVGARICQPSERERQGDANEVRPPWVIGGEKGQGRLLRQGQGADRFPVVFSGVRWPLTPAICHLRNLRRGAMVPLIRPIKAHAFHRHFQRKGSENSEVRSLVHRSASRLLPNFYLHLHRRRVMRANPGDE